MSRVSVTSMPRCTSVGQDGERALRTAVTNRYGDGRAARVLVVEDEALICVETADTFERHGFEVHIALSAEEALRRLHDGLSVDILFTDINLAGRMAGTALARIAREILPTLIVVYTSGTVAGVPQSVAGSVFVPKPYSPERVARMLSGMCAAQLENCSPHGA